VVGTRLSFAGSNARANYFSRFPNLDYVALARACGGVGFKAEKPGELRADINKALNADGPAIVDTKVIFGRKFDDCHSARPAGKAEAWRFQSDGGVSSFILGDAPMGCNLALPNEPKCSRFVSEAGQYWTVSPGGLRGWKPSCSCLGRQSSPADRLRASYRAAWQPQEPPSCAPRSSRPDSSYLLTIGITCQVAADF
jgi:hypothetical protein